ncbi:hypothetical protein HNR44_000398 [Geomicrobium halophilum]|uniref:Intracellular proteinase inhibitor BsuPI domain-containing protein n=1 Tax=Geomicrobium halophilum TaxID=549000 RepID=A0A841PI76_9BACL|nr:BsuPI-related putative proteinase inhibitor [Geomicrobium halophilum]MBB6448449.1 hypothetical protein [Geomicrobium halophilum]
MEENLNVQVSATYEDHRVFVKATLSNTGKDTVELLFRSSQRIEVRLYEEGDSEQFVYRSSRMMMYSQVVTTLWLDPEEQVHFTEEIAPYYFKKGKTYGGNVSVTIDRVNGEIPLSKPSDSFTVNT